MLILQSFEPAFGLPSPSAYCMKAICLLNMSGLAWRLDFDANVDNAPRRKFPVLVDGTSVIPDSTDIARYLEREKGCDFMPELTREEKAVSHTISRMIEEHLVHGLVYDRWLLDDIWPDLSAHFFTNAPDGVSEMVREHVRTGLEIQGTGRMTPKEVVLRMSDDFDALEDLLGNKPFLFGDEPTYADACAAPFLLSIMSPYKGTLLQQELEVRKTLLAYAERVRSEVMMDLAARAA